MDLVNEIAKWMYQTAVDSTAEGNWIFYSEDLVENFGLSVEMITSSDFLHEIEGALYEIAGVLDVGISSDGTFDICVELEE